MRPLSPLDFHLCVAKKSCFNFLGQIENEKAASPQLDPPTLETRTVLDAHAYEWATPSSAGALPKRDV